MTANDAKLLIRPLRAGDKECWRRLWHAYLEFYRTERPRAVYDVLWERLLNEDPRDGCGLIAVQSDRAVGIAHYYFQRHGWFESDVIYLQDLYVEVDIRGTGVGRRLIERIYAEADRASIPHVYWTTEAGNTVARRLYDRVGELTPFIKYQRAT